VYRAAAYLGNLLYRRGETEAGLAALQLGRDRVAALVERNRSDEALRELANAELSLGNFLDQIRRLDDAHAALSRSLALWRELAARHEEDASLRAEFAGTLHVLAMVDEGRGDRASARRLLDEAIDTRGKLAEGDPTNRRWRDSYASTLTDRCHLSAGEGQAAAGVADCERSIALNRALVREQPDNALWRQGLMRALNELSAAQRRAGHPELARQAAAEAIDLGKALRAARSRDTIVRQLWVVAHDRAAEAERTRSPAEARALLETALAEVRAMRAEQPTNARRRHDEADLLLFRGELEVAMARLDAAEASLTEARGALEPDRASGTEQGVELPALRARAALLAYQVVRARGHPSAASRELSVALAELAPLRARLDSEDTATLARLERLTGAGTGASSPP
jgi:tetratricopeptide (TPR) repeat protein